MSKIHFHKLTQMLDIILDIERYEETLHILSAINLVNKASINNLLFLLLFFQLLLAILDKSVQFGKELNIESICAILQPDINKSIFLSWANFLNLNSGKMDRCFKVFVSIEKLLQSRENYSITKYSIHFLE